MTRHSLESDGATGPARYAEWLTLTLGLAALGGVALTAFAPLSTADLAPRPQPARDYESALERVRLLKAGEDSSIAVVCRSRLLDHGAPTDRAIVLLHGVTSCPQQFASLGEELHRRGHNVLIPRLPRHGMANRFSDEMRHLTAGDLRALADTAVDIAHGLGREVRVLGLSGGGVVAGWIAQHRREVERAVLVAPAFGLRRMHPALHALQRNLMARLPNLSTLESGSYMPVKPVHASLRAASRGVGEMLRLGLAVERAARRGQPAARSLAVVTNASDKTVDNAITERVVRRWRRHGAQVAAYEFGPERGLIHDVIDPLQVRNRIDLVYPVLLDLIERR